MPAPRFAIPCAVLYFIESPQFYQFIVKLGKDPMAKAKVRSALASLLAHSRDGCVPWAPHVFTLGSRPFIRGVRALAPTPTQLWLLPLDPLNPI
jgi:hypothetical protein